MKRSVSWCNGGRFVRGEGQFLEWQLFPCGHGERLKSEPCAGQVNFSDSRFFLHEREEIRSPSVRAKRRRLRRAAPRLPFSGFPIIKTTSQQKPGGGRFLRRVFGLLPRCRPRFLKICPFHIDSGGRFMIQ